MTKNDTDKQNHHHLVLFTLFCDCPSSDDGTSCPVSSLLGETATHIATCSTAVVTIIQLLL